MKRLLLILTGLLVLVSGYTQSPQAFKYQAVVRDNSGDLLTEQTVNFQIDIIKGTVDGTEVYSETHIATTNVYGVVSLEIGFGTTADDFSAIEWFEDSYFITLWINGDEMGTTQLLSVPYALHAGTAETLIVNGQIKNVVDPTDDQDVATKAYVDRQITNPGIRIQAVIDSIECYGDVNGAIDLTVQGGTSPYTYEWDDGSTTADLDALGAGKYQVYVEDSNGMTGFRHFTLLAPEQIIVDYIYSTASGDIDITVSGGRPPYIYLWSNGSTTEDQSGLDLGTYTVQVTDALGCIVSQEVNMGGESLLLVEYLENPTSPAANYGNGPLAIKSPEAVHTLMVADKVHIIDIRNDIDFADGHIEGAVNMPAANVRAYIDATDLSVYDEISIVGYSGQTASWLTCLLQLAGYKDVYAMKWGMSGWHSDFDKWTANISNEKATLFVATSTDKAAAGDLPDLTTGYSLAEEIFEARFDAVLAEGFGAAAVSNADVYANLSNYYIINYWPMAEYIDPGHIDGAIQYTPSVDLALSTYLETLPTDKPIVIYDYTGQNSARVAAYLRIIGYDAKSLKFGTNSMIHDEMTKSVWTPAIPMEYDYVPPPTK